MSAHISGGTAGPPDSEYRALKAALLKAEAERDSANALLRAVVEDACEDYHRPAMTAARNYLRGDAARQSTGA